MTNQNEDNFPLPKYDGHTIPKHPYDRPNRRAKMEYRRACVYLRVAWKQQSKAALGREFKVDRRTIYNDYKIMKIRAYYFYHFAQWNPRRDPCPYCGAAFGEVAKRRAFSKDCKQDFRDEDAYCLKIRREECGIPPGVDARRVPWCRILRANPWFPKDDGSDPFHRPLTPYKSPVNPHNESICRRNL